MSDIEKMLADLEATHRQMVRDGQHRRQLMKSLTYTGNTRRRAPDFGKPGVKPAGIDLVKAELAFNTLVKSGALTDAQINEGRRRLMNLRPVETVLLK